jgi:uncharacterized membrane protein
MNPLENQNENNKGESEIKKNNSKLSPSNSNEDLGEIATLLEEEIPEIARDPRRKIAVIRKIQMMCSYSGPLPPPEMLERYGKIVPGAPERILKMAEKQSEHRIELEKVVVKGNSRRENQGLQYGFIISLVTIIGGIFLIYNNKNSAGLVAILTPLGILATSFLYSKHTETKRNRSKK